MARYTASASEGLQGRPILLRHQLAYGGGNLSAQPTGKRGDRYRSGILRRGDRISPGCHRLQQADEAGPEGPSGGAAGSRADKSGRQN